jgi:hypothetical protein
VGGRCLTLMVIHIMLLLPSSWCSQPSVRVDRCLLQPCPKLSVYGALTCKVLACRR